MSGLTADAKTLIDRARVETQVLVVSLLPYHSVRLGEYVDHAGNTPDQLKHQNICMLAATSVQL